MISPSSETLLSSSTLMPQVCPQVHPVLASMMLSYDSTWKAAGGHMSAYHGMPATLQTYC